MSKEQASDIKTHLKSARLEAGYTNRGVASTAVPHSPETIGRHERGEIPLTPKEVVQYAEVYDRPDLMLRYCPDCPIGRHLKQKVTDRDLPWASMRVSQRLRKGADYADRLEEIADDGIIDHTEVADFQEIVEFLRSLTETTNDVMLWALSQGFLTGDTKKEPPCATRDGSNG